MEAAAGVEGAGGLNLRARRASRESRSVTTEVAIEHAAATRVDTNLFEVFEVYEDAHEFDMAARKPGSSSFSWWGLDEDLQHGLGLTPVPAQGGVHPRRDGVARGC